MAQEAFSLDTGSASFRSSLGSQGNTLQRKIAAAFSGIIGFVALLVLTIVYLQMGRALRAEHDERGMIIATNLSDAAAGLIMGKNTLELNALTTKYARLDGISYVYIEDAKGEILTNSLKGSAQELGPSAGGAGQYQPGRVELTLGGRSVVETRMPVLEGRAGVTHVGMWADTVEKKVRATLLPVIALIGVAVAAGIVLVFLLARWIIRPLLGLAVVADKISKGHLDTPVAIDSPDEIGELARSLERMRASLKAAMSRLSRA